MASPPPPSPQYSPIPNPRSSWYPYNNGANFNAYIATLLIVLVSAFVCLLALNAAIRFFLNDPSPTTPASSSSSTICLPVVNRDKPTPTLLSHPTLVFSAGMKLAGAEAECAICLSEFVDGEGVRVLPRCKHGFHVQCIQGWLSSHNSCPTCRSNCLTTSPPPQEADVEAQIEPPRRSE
ncbi:hypothetical protein GIB67_033261 [Kingdonia uniflora]|uniref:RING-type domain-containing protein n=1 Tax=Kingdonia uniflora TaxID=39325 RepID=A0A7J7MPV4_9MAGN|nr:hypothetical protein GIB67_033261 [Kingdonia uniflora]